MLSEHEDLLRDPLFQLNALLWMAQPLPQSADITPILHDRGFRVFAIAPRLAPPPGLRLLARDKGINIQQSVRPDVVLENKQRGRYSITECKAASFGPQSSAAEQARCLLIVGGPSCAEVLAVSPSDISESVATFVVPESERSKLTTTLRTLRGELGMAELPSGEPCTLGLRVWQRCIAVVPDRNSIRFFELADGPIAFMPLEAETSLRPLYFIPYDPDIHQSQSERQFCKRILLERLLVSVITAVAHASLRTGLRLEPESLLNEATFGMFDRLENRDARKHMRRLARDFMTQLLRRADEQAPGALKFDPQEGWRVSFQNDEERERFLGVLTSLSSGHFASEKEPEPELFDALGQPEA